MAYGKDADVLRKTGSFRQRAQSFNNKRNENRSSGGGGTAPFFVNQYKPPLGTDPDMIRIIEGKHLLQQLKGSGEEAVVEEVELPFYMYAEHFDGRNEKSAICSAGPFAFSKKKAQPCHGCEIYWSTRETQADGKKKSDRMSRREMYVWSIVDYGVYHKMEQIDNNGQIRRNESTGEAYTRWVKCSGMGCDGCKAGKESKRGDTRHWPMGWAHYQTLLDIDRQVGRSCRTCGTMDSIQSVAWVCAACGELMIDMRTTSLKMEDIDKATTKDLKCGCGFTGLPVEIMQCMACSPQGRVAARATLFDVDMNVSRVAAAAGQGKQTALSVTRWSNPRPVDPNYTSLWKPLPLEKIYAPTPLNIQAEQFGVKGTPPPTDNSTGSGRQPMTGEGHHRPFASSGLPAAPTMGAPMMGPPPGAGTMSPPPMQQFQPPGFVPPASPNMAPPGFQPPPLVPQPAAPAPVGFPGGGGLLPPPNMPRSPQ